MKIEDLLSQPFDAIRTELIKKTGVNIGVAYKDIENQMDSTKHAVHDPTKRKAKVITDDSGTRSEDVCRISMPFQQLIVDRAVGFLNVGKIKIDATVETDNEKTVHSAVKGIWTKNKLNYKNVNIAKTLFSECEVAELWYVNKVPGFFNSLKAKFPILGSAQFEVRVKVLSNSNGDLLYPHFDEYGDMDAFSREYKITDGDKTIIHFDIYTSFATYKNANIDGKWVSDPPIKNDIGKIPVIYGFNKYPQYIDVQGAIERFENSSSNLGDTNDYFGSPILLIDGEVEGLSKKGERGKLLQLANGAKATYLSWDNSPESVKLELTNLETIIYSGTQTPNISFSEVKGLGNLSGVALKLMFLDAHMKAAKNEGVFGEYIQRRLNLLKAIIGKMVLVRLGVDADNIEINPVFTYYLPTNTKEDIETLSTATGGNPIMSQKKAVEMNPYVTDSEAELEQIKAEQGASIDTQTQDTANY